MQQVSAIQEAPVKRRPSVERRSSANRFSVNERPSVDTRLCREENLCGEEPPPPCEMEALFAQTPSPENHGCAPDHPLAGSGLLSVVGPISPP